MRSDDDVPAPLAVYFDATRMDDTKLADLGLVGLGVMGRNLALNLDDHGCRVAVWNLEPEATQAFLAEHGSRRFLGATSLAELVTRLEKPRSILLSIRAGDPVDEVLGVLAPLLEPGDVVIDGGNTHYLATERRRAALAERDIHFVGLGISGGEEGARRGPSLMAGCTPHAWGRLRPLLSKIAAATDAGPAVAHLGPGGAGHFVKMVHNGIEYGDMQLIAESYDVMKRGLGLEATQIRNVFLEWGRGPLASFLIEITAEIFGVVDTETRRPLVDLVLDRAGQKGTGQWALEAALELGVPAPTFAAALVGRGLSALKAERVNAAPRIRGDVSARPSREEHGAWLSDLGDALLASKLCSYAQGFQLIRAAAERFDWQTPLAECARIWRGGCIIRARLLDAVMRAYGERPDLPHLFLDRELEGLLYRAQPGWRATLGRAHELGIPVPALGASLSYFDAYRSARLPQNLTQAQRDAFGAHTYEREDHPERGPLHTDWLQR